MEVIDESSSWLCDYEVYKHLSDAKSSRNQNVRLPENILTVEFEVTLASNILFTYFMCRLLITLKSFLKLHVKILKELRI